MDFGEVGQMAGPITMALCVHIPLNDIFIYCLKIKVKLCAYIKENTKNHDEFVCANQCRKNLLILIIEY